MAHLELPTTALIGYEDITVGATGIKTLTIPIDISTAQPCTIAFVQVQRSGVRCRFDGGNPSTTSGIILAVGDAIQIVGANAMAGAKFVSDSNQTVTLSVTYFS